MSSGCFSRDSLRACGDKCRVAVHVGTGRNCEQSLHSNRESEVCSVSVSATWVRGCREARQRVAECSVGIAGEG